MLTINQDGNSLRMQQLVYKLRDVMSHPLLALEPVSEIFHNPRKLGQPEDLPTWNVCHGRLAEEWQQMVFAERNEPDSLQDYHVAAFIVDSLAFPLEDPHLLIDGCVMAARHLKKRLGNTFRCIFEIPFRRIKTREPQNLAVVGRHLFNLARTRILMSLHGTFPLY